MGSMRTVLSGLGLAFTAYQAVRGLFWTEIPEYPWLMVAALAAYIAASVLSILVPPTRRPAGTRGKDPLPLWVAILCVALAAVIPSAVGVSVGDPAALDQIYTTWYVGGFGTIMTIIVVRRRPWFAWTGTVLLAVGAMAWMGPLAALGRGVVGSIVWVALAHLMVVQFDRAERDAEELARLQGVTSAWQAAQEGRERERREQVQTALAVGGPTLARVVATQGQLTDEERREAGLAESRLRDELRGPRLLDEQVRIAIDAARMRGAKVSVFDEGGLDAVDDERLDHIRAEIAEALVGATSSRIIIRTSPHDRVAVTVVGRSRVGEAGFEEDSVDLWREIEFPQR